MKKRYVPRARKYRKRTFRDWLMEHIAPQRPVINPKEIDPDLSRIGNWSDDGPFPPAS